LSKILKNSTGLAVSISDIGLEVPLSGQLVIDVAKYSALSGSSDVINLLGDGTLIYNDGTNDLNLSDALDHIKDFFPNLGAVDGATGIQGLQGDAGDAGAQGVQGVQGAQGPIGVDGPIGPTGPAGTSGALEEYQYAESLGITSSSTNWIEKLKLTTTNLVGGFYRIAWSYEYEVNDSMRRIQIKMEIDDSINIFDITPELRDDYFFPAAGFRRVNLASGIHEIDIDFRSDNSHGSLRNVCLELWKVG